MNTQPLAGPRSALCRYAGQYGPDMRRLFQLRAAGYRVVDDHGGNGVWLSSQYGASWFPSVEAAYQAARTRVYYPGVGRAGAGVRTGRTALAGRVRR